MHCDLSVGDKDSPREVAFYSKFEVPYGCFANLSEAEIQWCGATFPTTEHAYQAMKFLPHDPESAALLALKGAPYGVARLARRWQMEGRARFDWDDARLDVMSSVVTRKFAAHPELREILVGTGESPIRERTDKDPFWGRDDCGNGENRLGELLELVRSTAVKGGEQGLMALIEEFDRRVSEKLMVNHGVTLEETLQKLRFEMDRQAAG